MHLDTMPVDLPAHTDDLSDYLRALGAELRLLRERRGWTRRDLKVRLRSDISLQTLATYELGTRQCSVARLVEICLALDEVPHQLLFRVHQQVCPGRPAEPATTRIRVDLRTIDDHPALAPLRRWALTKLAERTTAVTLDASALGWMAQLCGLTVSDLTAMLTVRDER